MYFSGLGRDMIIPGKTLTVKTPKQLCEYVQIVLAVFGPSMNE